MAVFGDILDGTSASVGTEQQNRDSQKSAPKSTLKGKEKEKDKDKLTSRSSFTMVQVSVCVCVCAQCQNQAHI